MTQPPSQPTPSPDIRPGSTGLSGTETGSGSVFATISGEDWRRSLASVGRRKPEVLEALRNRLSSPASRKSAAKDVPRPRKSNRTKELERTHPLIPGQG